MKRILLLLLALTLLLLPACAEQPDIENGRIHTSKVESRKTAEYGDNVYYVIGKLYRYNRKSGEIGPLCNNSCDPFSSSCMLCAVMIENAQVVNTRLYFNGYSIETKENFFAYYDLITEETKVLLTLSSHENAEVNRPILADGWLYYTAQRLREGGDATNPDDYEPFVGRMPMDGGQTEFVCLIEDTYAEHPYAVIDGRVVTEYNNIFYAIDAAAGERKVLFDPEDHGFLRFIDKINYLDGYFYCLAAGEGYFESAYYPDKLGKTYLIRIDAVTGEVKQLAKEPVHGLIVTDDAVYFTEQTIRHFDSPEYYTTHTQNISVSGSYEILYACDLDGGNRREVFSDPNLDLNYYWNRIIDNCLYGTIYQYDETEHKMVNFYGKVDLKTGEVTPATEVK